MKKVSSGLPKAEIFGRNQIFLVFGFRFRPPKFFSKYSAFGFVLKVDHYPLIQADRLKECLSIFDKTPFFKNFNPPSNQGWCHRLLEKVIMLAIWIFLHGFIKNFNIRFRFRYLARGRIFSSIGLSVSAECKNAPSVIHWYVPPTISIEE